MLSDVGYTTVPGPPAAGLALLAGVVMVSQRRPLTREAKSLASTLCRLGFPVNEWRESGQPVEPSTRIAAAIVGQVQWELIQQLDDKSIYARE